MSRSKSAANALLEYEAGQELVEFGSPMADSGDHKTFTAADGLWSGYEGKEPVIRPNGLFSGGDIVPAAADKVSVSAAKAYIKGELVNIAGNSALAISRGADANTHRINSIVIEWDSGTSAYVFAVKANAAHTAFVDGRGANAGQAVLIGVDDIEVGMIYLTTTGAGVVSASEIFQVPGVHQERYDTPLFDDDREEGTITFLAALPCIHTGEVPKRTYVQYYTPIMTEQPNSADFVPAEVSHSVSSTPVYNGTVGSSSSSLGQASFNTRVASGVTDNILKQKNKTIWVRFYPDRYIDEHILTQGKLGVARSFPAGDNIIINCTISAQSASVEKES